MGTVSESQVHLCAKIMEVSNFLLDLRRSNQRAIRGWDLEAKKLFPTLNRKSLEEGWGFSLIGGVDYLEAAGQFSGIVTRKGETGLWLKVKTVKPNSAASEAEIQTSDFILRINGRIVFHMSPKDVERIISDSGFTLHLDTERNSPKGTIYDNGLHNIAMNFLYTDYRDYHR